MNSNTITYGILRAVAIIAGILGLLWFLYQVQSVIVYIGFASVISLIGRPFVIFLKNKLKFNATLAVVFALLIIITLFLSIFMLFIPILTEQSQLISTIDMNQLGNDLDQLNEEISNYFKINKLSINELISNSNLKEMLDLKAIPELINSFLSGFGSILVGLFSILFLSFFLLKDSQLLENSLLILVNKEK